MAAGTALRKSWQNAPATWSLAAVTLLVWVLASAAQAEGVLIRHASFLPERLLHPEGYPLLVPAWLTPLTTVFVHAGFFHLALNLLALIGFGRAVEPAVGTVGILLLYIIGATVAASTFFLVVPAEFGLYWIGAAGAAAALLGAYAVLFGRARVRAKSHMARWAYALWLCLGWAFLSVLVVFVYVDFWAIYYAPACVASFAAGLLFGRLFFLFRYRNA